MTHADNGFAEIVEVGYAMVLNTHLEWVPEFTMRLADGRCGRGSTPYGETPSVYEQRRAQPVTGDILAAVRRTVVGARVDQGSLDGLVLEHGETWGTRTGFAVSTAFHEAVFRGVRAAPGPRLVFNLVNGGSHAYTNPVAADITEILLVPRTDDTVAAIDGYRAMLDRTRLALNDIPPRTVGGHRVHDIGPDTNEAVLRLVRDLLSDTGLDGMFTLMVDASAGDWFEGGRYHLPVSGYSMEPPALLDYWLELLDRYEISMLEDPFAETDTTSWKSLHTARPTRCAVLGDNLTSTLVEELAAKAELIDGVLVKPDQNGTVSGAAEFARQAARSGLRLIASHRSVETDALFLPRFATEIGADFLKIGPFADFSAVLRVNELLRVQAR